MGSLKHSREFAGPIYESDKIPDSTRRAVMERCAGICENCGQKTAITLHHLHYRTTGEELPQDLEALCWDCHRSRHRDPNGDYWRDPEEMADYWSGFYGF